MNSHNDSLADDDPTNELPVLDLDSTLLDSPSSPEDLEKAAHVPALTLDAETDPQLAELEAVRSRLNEDIESLRTELEVLRSSNAALETDLERRDDAISSLTRELSEQKAERQQLADDIATREAQPSELRTQEADATLQASLTTAREKLSTLEHYIANRAEHWQQLEAMLVVEQDRVKELEAELSQREQRSVQAQHREVRAEAQAASLRQRLISESDAAMAHARAMEELLARNDTLAGERDKANEQVATLEAEIVQWRELSDQLRSELANQTRDLQDSSQAADREARRAAKFAKQLATRDSKIEKLETMLAARTEERDELLEQTRQLEISLEEQRSSTNQDDETRSTLVAELESSLASLEQQQRDQESLSERLQGLTQQHESVTEQAATLAEELNARNAVVGHLENQVERLRAAESDQGHAAQAAETQVAELSDRLQHLEAELAQAQTALKTAGVELEQAREATAAASLQHADQLDRIAHLEEQLQAGIESSEELAHIQKSQPRHNDESEPARETTADQDDAFLNQQEHIEELRMEIANSETRRQEQDLLIGELRRQLRDKDQQLPPTRPRGGALQPGAAHPAQQVEDGAAVQSPDDRPIQRAPTRVLVCVSGDQEVSYPLYKDILSIGRTGDNDIQIRTHYVSRNHARIVIRNGEAFVEDLDSKNGVYLNSLRVSSETLKSGDRLTIGETEFRYLVASPRSN